VRELPELISLLKVRTGPCAEVIEL